MGRLTTLWARYATPRNLKMALVLFSLAALAIAGGAPSAGSGMG